MSVELLFICVLL